MAENDKNTSKKEGKDGLSLIIGGIFILTLVFATYNYFNKGREKNNEEKKEKNFIESIFDRNKGDLNGEGAMEGSEDENIEEESKLKITSYEIEWVANDYEEGDIKGDSYTVVEGDTLWEIAEAVYGSGFEWGKILQANSDSIGYLPNGSQALIIPGQVLEIPQS